MTHDEALMALAGHPHLRRYRELCEDDADPETREAYRTLVIRLARGEVPSPAPAIPVSYGDPPLRPCGACP